MLPNILEQEKHSLNVHIRWMIRRDMEQVLQIEEDNFFPYAWNEENFLQALRQRSVIGMVAEFGEKIYGYMVYELHKDKLEVLNMAVKADRHRRNIGRQMIMKLKSKLSSHRRTEIELIVGEHNLNAHLFLKAMGFRAVEVLRDYYEDRIEDGYRFRYLLHESLDFSSSLRSDFGPG